MLGETLRQLGRNNDAIETYEEIIRRRPDLRSGYLGLGKLYAFSEPSQPEKALAVFDRAIAELDPQSTAFMYTMKGSVYLKEKKWDEALDAYDAALNLDSKMGLAHSGIGAVKLKRGDFDGAIEALRKSVQLSPREGTCHRSLAQALISKVDEDGKYPHVDEALKHAKQAVATFKFSPTGETTPSSWLHTLGVAYYRSGDYEQAQKNLQDAYDVGFHSIGNQAFLTMTHWQLGDQDEAKKQYDQILQEKENRDFTAAEKAQVSEAAKLLQSD
jgi:tetratricopeptide (TPR) repeat protein